MVSATRDSGPQHVQRSYAEYGTNLHTMRATESRHYLHTPGEVPEASSLFLVFWISSAGRVTGLGSSFSEFFLHVLISSIEFAFTNSTVIFEPGLYIREVTHVIFRAELNVDACRKGLLHRVPCERNVTERIPSHRQELTQTE